MSDINHERLLRAIRCLQLIQRTNAPKSSIFKAAGKALGPLMTEQSTMPPLPAKAPKAAQNFSQPPGEAQGAEPVGSGG
jgi:hypothetical protein